MNRAIILAAGKSERFGTSKLWKQINEKPLLHYSLETFNNHPLIDEITLVVRASDLTKVRKFKFNKITSIVVGGKTRMQSLKKGLAPADNIIIHNGANPCVTADEITAVIDMLKKHPAVSVARSISGTVKRISKNRVQETVPRDNLMITETPQGLQYDVLKKALTAIKKEVTDDIHLAEMIGINPILIPAHPTNIKVTTPADLLFCRAVLEQAPRDFRFGIGEDSHRFSTRKGLVLGGVKLPNHNRLEANSDGDVILHAVATAILQARGKGSLGKTADSMCANGITDSRKYVTAALDQEWPVHNVSIMIEAADPKIDPLVPRIKKDLAELLHISREQISIAAHTGEKLTPFGRGEGIRCLATVTLKKI